MTDLKNNFSSIVDVTKSQNYNLIARIFPAALCLFPPMTFYYFYINTPLQQYLHWIYASHVVTGVAIPIILLYSFAQINKFIAKEFFEHIYFQDELRMPTTNYLLYSDMHFPEDYKKQIHKKIETDFQITLLNKQGEGNNEKLARKKIVAAVGHIKRIVGNGKLVLQHNMEYGFFRNLIGGSVLASFISLFNIWFFIFYTPNMTATKISIVMLILYILVVLLSKLIMTRVGNRYALILIQEYMNLT